MTVAFQSKLLILLLSLLGVSSEDGRKFSIKRSYQVPIAVMNDAQGLQYYAAGPMFTAIPTVLIPNQIGLTGTPIASVILPPSNEPKPAQEFQETSTPAYTSIKTSRVPAHIYKQKLRTSRYGLSGKRPTTYVNSVYGHPVRMKPLSSVSPQGQKGSSFSVQPSIDLTGQYSQEVGTSLYPSTVGPPVVSTYGPAKAVDYQHKTRVSGQGVYHRLKGPSRRIPYYPPKKVRVYSHVHKDHVHNHYLPVKHSLPLYKHTSKYAAPTYLPPVSSTPSTISETSSEQEAPIYPYQTNTHVRFPETQEVSIKEQTELRKPTSPGDVTQAIIKTPGVINNYDAALPIHVPSKKPYQFEVNEILKNSDLHFVQETGNNVQNVPLLQYAQKIPYQNAHLFNQPLITMNQGSILSGPGPLDIYNLPPVSAYQANQIVPDQDLGTSETVKVPVAVIRGAHNIGGQGLFGFTMKRQDDTTEEETKKTFTPSRRTSDWIPMSGNGVPIVTDETKTDVDYPANRATVKDAKKERHQVGDIISGKIPEEFSPKDLTSGQESDVISGKIPFVRALSSERDRRKGSVIDVYPSSGSDVSKMGDTSNLVVSSVIKFS